MGRSSEVFVVFEWSSLMKRDERVLELASQTGILIHLRMFVFHKFENTFKEMWSAFSLDITIITMPACDVVYVYGLATIIHELLISLRKKLVIHSMDLMLVPTLTILC